MTFDGINYLAVLMAAVAAWVLSVIWYRIPVKQWLAANGKRATDLGPASYPKSYVLWVFVGEPIMARILAEVVGRTGDVTLKQGLIWAALCFTGFVGPVMVTNRYFFGRRGMLGILELGHWLAVLLLMGAIIGAFGVD